MTQYLKGSEEFVNKVLKKENNREINYLDFKIDYNLLFDFNLSILQLNYNYNYSINFHYAIFDIEHSNHGYGNNLIGVWRIKLK